MALLLFLFREAEGRLVEASTLSLYSLQVKHYRQPHSHIPPHLSLHCAIFHLLPLKPGQGRRPLPIRDKPSTSLQAEVTYTPHTCKRRRKEQRHTDQRPRSQGSGLKVHRAHSCLRMKGS